MHKIGEVIAVQFAVSDPASAGLVDADATPTVKLLINAVPNAASVVVTREDPAVTGWYIATVTLPAVSEGDVLQLRVSPATVATVKGGGIIWSSVGVTARPADVLAALTALGLGTGPVPVTITIDDGTDPVPNAAVTVYDAGVPCGTGTTDANGEVVLDLAAGTYTVSIYHVGYSSTPQTLVVPDDGDPTYSITAMGEIPAATVTGQCTGYGYVYDEDGIVEPSQDVLCQLINHPRGSGLIVDDAQRTETSGAGGLVTFERLWIGGTYSFWRAGSSLRQRITILASDVDGDGRFALPNFRG